MLALIELLDLLFKGLSLLILVRVLVSWAPALGIHHSAVRSIDHTVTQLTAPIIDPIRRVMPPVGGLDLSPLVALLLLGLAHQLLKSVFFMLLP